MGRTGVLGRSSHGLQFEVGLALHACLCAQEDNPRNIPHHVRSVSARLIKAGNNIANARQRCTEVVQPDETAIARVALKSALIHHVRTGA